jgi:hypothetical protein
MRTIKRYLPATLFFLATLAPALSCLYSPALKPYLETRLKGGDASALEETVRRTNPLWTTALDIYSTTLYRLGISSNLNAARVGLDGWTFLGNEHNENFDQATRKRVISDDEARQWAETLDDQRAWLKTKGIPLLFVVGPMKASVYPEKLPHWAQAARVGKPSAIDQFTRFSGDELLDVRPGLIREKATALTYSKLNSHWTDYGAYIAWQDVAKRLQRELPGFQAYGIAPVTRINHVNYGNEFDAMVNIHVPNAWDVPSLAEPTPVIEAQNAQGAWVSLGGNPQTDVLDLPRHTRNPSANNHLKALVLRDSMGNSLSPFLQGAFAETFQEHHHFFPGSTLNLPGLVEKYKPDVVIYVMTERFSIAPLGNLFYWRSEKGYREASVGASPLMVRGTSGSAAASSGRFELTDRNPMEPAVVHLRLNSKFDGAIRLAYGQGAGVKEFYESITAGANDLYFSLPSRPGNASINVATLDAKPFAIVQADSKSMP